MKSGRKHQFSWEMLGNIKEGRPNLGPVMRLEVYRLMQYCFQDVMEEGYGSEAADKLTYRAGYLAGTHFHQNLVGETESIGDMVNKLQVLMKELGIGILRMEEHDEGTGSMVMTVSEDLDCSGLPLIDSKICTFDEGFIAAILDASLGKKHTVKEIDCWCAGDRTCRFSATVE